MKSILFFSIVLSTSFIMHAQAPKWAWAKADSANKLTASPAHVIAGTHNKILWGEVVKKRMSYGSATLGDYQMSELDSAGNFLGSTTITGKFTLLDAHPDNAGNWYVLGQYFDTVNFPGGLQYTRDPYAYPTGSDYFVFRLNSGSLSVAWAQHIGTNTYSTASAFTVANNSLYIVIDSVTTYVCKLDLSTGNRTTLWPQTGLSRVSSIAVDDIGNVYLAGSCSHDTMQFNGHLESVPYFYNSYIVRYKASGAFDWVKWMDDITCTYRTLSLVNNNFIYYSGQLNDSLVLGSFHIHGPQILANGYMAARLDSSGQVYWARQEIDTLGSSLTVDNVYTASVTKDSCLQLFLRVRGAMNFGNGIFSPGPNTKTLATIVCIQPDNTTKWLKSIAGINTTAGHIISTGKDVYVTGSGYDSTAIQFDSLSAPVTIGGNTPYLAKLNAIATPADTTHHGTNVTVINNVELTISPNPANSIINILGMEKLNGSISLTLSDVYGKIVFARTYTHPQGNEAIDVSGYARGLYFLELKSAGYRSADKMILY